MILKKRIYFSEEGKIMYTNYQVNLSEGESGNWKIERFEVTKEQAAIERMRSMFNGGRGVPAGVYTALKYKGQIIMSDTPDEIRDHFSIIRMASGHVLLNGLGLGMVLKACMEKDSVTHITVIENSSDVIKLSGKYYKEKYGDKLTIIHADAFEYKPPKNIRYGAVWHDIWAYISEDNLPEMHKLHRKYGRKTNWQGSWCRESCERYRERDRNW